MTKEQAKFHFDKIAERINDENLHWSQAGDLMLSTASEFAKQEAIEFAEWCDSEGFQQFKVGGIWKNVRDSHIPESQEFSTDQLYSRFLEQKQK